MTISTNRLPSGITGTPYVAALEATGGTPNYTWSVTAGNLPSGVSLSPTTGIISGTPAVTGNFSFNLTLTDSNDPSQTRSSTATIAVVAPPLKIAASTPASVTVGTTYSQTLAAIGGVAPYTWSITSGKLPAGLTLGSATGVISGTPTTGGTAKFTVTVRDSEQVAQTHSLATSIDVAPIPLKIVTVVLPSATRGAPYTQSLQVSGGTPAYKWSIASGSLPVGLTLAPTGIISGTPTASCVMTFTAAVSDSSNPAQTMSAPVSITVASTPLSIATPALIPATAGAAYSQTLHAIGGAAPYSWSITSGSLPSGLILTSTTGTISGTPTASGTFAFTATVTDSGSPVQSVSAATGVIVAPTPVTILASTLPSVVVGSPYSQTLHASGGNAPYSWSITSGSLPAGLTLTSSTGAISGTPSVSGTSSFTATVTDSSNPTQTASAARQVFITPAALAIAPSILPAVTIGTPYSNTLKATGGTAPYVWSITSGKLPQGLALAASAGTISGVPTASGVSTFTATVTDSGSPSQATSATAAVVVAPTLLAITSSAFPPATVGTSYSQSLQGTGGSAPYTWAILSGSLPPGLSLSSSSGAISGVPTASGTSTFTATVTDSSNPTQVTSTTATIIVAPSALPPTTAPPTTLTPSPLVITTSALPSTSVGTGYTQTLQATGGVAPYVWSITSGQLPAGLSIASTGTISGTPTSGSSSSFTVSVSDSGSPIQMQSATLTITAPAATNPLTITSSALPSGTTGSAYAQVLHATGGTPAYTWSITSGNLPAGLTLAKTTGTISGTSASTGVSTFTAKVSDNGNPVQTQSVTVSLTVLSANQAGPGTTWYVQPNGGPRYSATYLPTGDSCDGQSNANMVIGGGPNQNCAWNDPRYVWADGSAAGLMAMSGGDTLILSNTYPAGETAWRFAGRATGGTGTIALFNGYQGGGGDPYTDYNINFPAGTSGAHTRILGANYASCGTGQKTNIFGGFATLAVINLQNTSYVDIQCLDITDHNNCIKYGTAGLPSTCSNSVPYTDYANAGIITVTNGVSNQLSGNILIQDVDIHGFPYSGIAGAIGGPITMTRVTDNYNGFAGWDFDFHTGANGIPNNPLSSINASYVTMQGNGCNEEYPIVDPIPITYCYSILNGGFGDAWSGQDSNLASMTCDHCIIAWNVKDAFFGPHTAIGSVTITNSAAYNNGGQTWKSNLASTGQFLMKNTLTNANCRRMADPWTGAPSTFNTYINGADYCRADGSAISLLWPVAGSFEIDNSTFVSASQNVALDFGCWNQFSAVSVGSGGTGYTVGDLLYVGGTQATVTVTSVSGGGVITGISLTSPGQVTNASVPFTETYVFGGTGTGAQITVTATTPATCNGGPRILRNNNFIGYTNSNNISWNGSQITFICYSSCQEQPGTSDDTMWTTRSNNNFYGYASGVHGACTYAGEVCGSPRMTDQPSQTWTNETQLDSFTPSLPSTSNSFYPSSGSPLIGAGVTFSGIPTGDYYGAATTSRPVIGAVAP